MLVCGSCERVWQRRLDGDMSGWGVDACFRTRARAAAAVALDAVEKLESNRRVLKSEHQIVTVESEWL
jgi:hypothetical protein